MTGTPPTCTSTWPPTGGRSTSTRWRSTSPARRRTYSPAAGRPAGRTSRTPGAPGTTPHRPSLRGGVVVAVARRSHGRAYRHIHGIGASLAAIAARGLFEPAVGIPVHPARIQAHPEPGLVHQAGQRPVHGVRGSAVDGEAIYPRPDLHPRL